MGSGVWTAVLLPLISLVGLWPVFGISIGFIAMWLCVYAFYFRPRWALEKNAKLAAASTSLLTLATAGSTTEIGPGSSSSDVRASDDRTPLLSVNNTRHSD